MAKNMATKSERPVGVTILSILAYIGAAFTLIGGLLMLVGSAFVSTFIAAIIPQFSAFATIGTALTIILGIIFLALAVLDFFVGKGLWNGKNWARILVLVFAGLSVLGSLFPFSIANLVISAVIVWYLGFNKEAIAYFK